MAGITPDYSDAPAQANRTTQPMIIQRFLEDTGLGWVGVTTGTSDVNITDATMLDNDIGDDQELRGSWVRMCSGTSANLGRIRAIQSQDPAAGTFTFAPALPAPTTSGDRYEVWRTPMRPTTVLNTLDRLTSQFGLFLPSRTFLSEIPDYDMEQTGTAAWAATNATLAKVTTGPGVNGKQALSVLTTAANGYAACSRTFGVDPGIPVWVSVQFTPADRTVANTGVIQLVDAATGTVLDSVTTTAKRTVRLKKLMSIPATTNVVNLRVGSQENDVTGIWDELVFLDANASDVPLPWWMTTEASLKEVRQWAPISSGAGGYEYDPAFLGDPAEEWLPDTDGFTNGGQLRLRSNRALSELLWVQGPRIETAWASLTETKNYDTAWAAAGLALNVYQLIVGQYAGTGVERDRLMERTAYWQDQWNQHTKRVLSRRRNTQSGPTEWVYI